MKRRKLEILLQGVRGHPSPSPLLEQYQTPATIAADVLYFAHGRGDVSGRKVLDAGCGTGIFGIGAKLLGAEEAIGIDVDEDALAVARTNAHNLGVDVRLLTMDMEDFAEPCDTAIQNPPFGAQRRHADEPFLVHALRVAPVVYTFHNAETEAWVDTKADALGGAVTERLRFSFPIPRTFPFHEEDVVEVPVTLFRIVRGGQTVKSGAAHRADS